MLSDVRNYYGLVKDFGQAGYFETDHSEQIVRELKFEIKAGKLLALSGIVGSGRTTMYSGRALTRQGNSGIQNRSRWKRAKSVWPATEKDFKIPTQPERARNAGFYQKEAEADRPVHRRRA
jgi:ABC-type glutathione transport system ATPase component